MAKAKIITGHVLSFEACLFDVPAHNAARVDEAVLIKDGRIAEIGSLDALQRAARGAELHRFDGHLISAGFRRPYTLPADRHRRILGQAPDGVVTDIHVPQGNEVPRPERPAGMARTS